MNLTTHLHLSAEVKNAWSYTSTPQCAFMPWCLVKHRGNFTLYYISYLYFPVGVKHALNCTLGMIFQSMRSYAYTQPVG